ncbi:MAG: DUF1015 domain-containing protein [Cyclobacteriaceae bacterium]
MAEIHPFKGWRYNPHRFDKIDELTSPLFDVVSQAQLERLYQHAYNSIHLAVPRENAQKLRSIISEWKNEKIIDQDQIPCIYVYYQHFTLPGSDHELVRKGFIANMRIYDWEENMLLRHEDTMPFSVQDRQAALEITQLHTSPTHGLYTDESHNIEKLLDVAIKSPIYETEDYQGVRDSFARISDPNIIQTIVSTIKDKQIILADGHHRYAGSLANMRKSKSNNDFHEGNEGYNFHLMYFTNTESEDLRVLPTHRLIKKYHSSNLNVLERLKKYFDISLVDDPVALNEIILGKRWHFGLLMQEDSYVISVKEDFVGQFDKRIPKVVKELDLTVLHEFALNRALDMTKEEQKNPELIRFERNFTACHKEVMTGEAAFAFITQEIPMNTIKKVCYSGHTLPQKSTYFYPKVVNGFVFSSID